MPTITQRDLDEMLTKAEAAEVLGVSVSTLERMIRARQIDVVRIGSGRGRPRITYRAILDHANRGASKPTRRRAG